MPTVHPEIREPGLLASLLAEDSFRPAEPQTLEQTGISPIVIETLICKYLLQIGSTSGRDIGQRLRPQVALLPIGAYNPSTFRNVHTDPSDATRAFLDLNARWMVPMHYGTFRLSHEPIEEPLQLLEKEAKAAGIEDRVVVMEEGVTKFF